MKIFPLLIKWYDKGAVVGAVVVGMDWACKDVQEQDLGVHSKDCDPYVM